MKHPLSRFAPSPSPIASQSGRGTPP
ncbi:hypothetical protein PMI14_05100, partial [Acidovorax sp. CF316]